MRYETDASKFQQGRTWIGAAMLLVSWTAGCDHRVETATPPAAEPTQNTGQTSRSAPASDDRPLVIFLGDSITAGFGVHPEEAFPQRLATRLQAEDVEIRVLNAGVSGDTTAGGLSRLDWLLRQKPQLLVVQLGGNDALRGQPLESIEKNLRALLKRSLEAGCKTLFLGMRIPPSYGPDYAEGFAALYDRLATELEVDFVPFFMDGVGGVADLNLADQIHPNPQGHEKLADNVLPHLRKLLRAPPRLPK